jgi:hypothetical protein
MSKTVASLLVALIGLVGYQLSDSAALEIAMILLQVGGILGAWIFRTLRGDVSVVGIKKSEPTP